MVSFTLHFATTPYKIIDILVSSFFMNFSIHILDKNNMSVKDNYLFISKLQTASFYHKNLRSYKLLNMTTPKKSLCNVRTFSSKNKACDPICKLLNTIYEHYIDKEASTGYLTLFPV